MVYVAALGARGRRQQLGRELDGDRPALPRRRQIGRRRRRRRRGKRGRRGGSLGRRPLATGRVLLGEDGLVERRVGREQRRRVTLFGDVELLDARALRLRRHAHGRVRLRGAAHAAALALRLEVHELGGGGGLLGFLQLGDPVAVLPVFSHLVVEREARVVPLLLLLALHLLERQRLRRRARLGAPPQALGLRQLDEQPAPEAGLGFGQP